MGRFRLDSSRGGPTRGKSLLLVAVATLVFSGCAGDASSTSRPSASTSVAPPPTPGPETGSVSGTVTDEELRAVAGARVTLLELTVEATTDATGVFTFNELQPGTYRLFVERLGYVAAARKVDVRIGEVTQVGVVLAALAIPDEPYVRITPLRAFIQVAHAFVNYYVPFAADPCGDCVHFRFVEKSPKAGVVEATFTNGIPQPLDDIWYNMNKNWTNETGTVATRGGAHVKAGYLQNRGASTFSDTEVGNMKGVEKLLVYITGGYTSVSVNKRVDMWISFAYHGPLPDGHSALPPA